jgi:hypothetical protein
MSNEIPKDRVERYLVELISDEYGAVFDGEPRPGEYATPALGVVMRDDTSDRLGWAVCHAVVKGAFKRLGCADNFGWAREFLNHLIETVRDGVRRGRPVINGKSPPWYDVAVGDFRIRVDAQVVTFEVQFDFSTGLAPAEVG